MYVYVFVCMYISMHAFLEIQFHVCRNIHMYKVLDFTCVVQNGMNVGMSFYIRTIVVTLTEKKRDPYLLALRTDVMRMQIRPAILTGTLGYTVGTAIGCLVGLKVLKPMAAWQLGLRL